MEKILVREFNNKFILNKEFYDKIGRIGKMDNDYIILELEEALYCIKKGWIKLEGINNFLDFIKKYKNILNMKKFYVFEDLRNKGHYLDTENVSIILYTDYKKEKILYYVYAIYENEFLYISRYFKFHMDSKNLNKILFAIIDIENDIVYYEINELFL
ncbi:hypothetical protein [Candidatus Nanopusillus massiliensis]